MRPELLDLIHYRMERSYEALEEAQLLIENGHLRTGVNRLYYACFYAVSALLLYEGHSAVKHSGVLSLFDRHWILPGRLPKTMGRFYHRLFDRRQKSDYADLADFERKDVQAWMLSTSDFVGRISSAFEKLGSNGKQRNKSERNEGGRGRGVRG